MGHPGDTSILTAILCRHPLTDALGDGHTCNAHVLLLQSYIDMCSLRLACSFMIHGAGAVQDTSHSSPLRSIPGTQQGPGPLAQGTSVVRHRIWSNGRGVSRGSRGWSASCWLQNRSRGRQVGRCGESSSCYSVRRFADLLFDIGVRSSSGAVSSDMAAT